MVLTQYPSTVLIDNKSYRLGRDDTGTVQTFSQQFANEPPWAGGVPELLNDPIFTWHQGGFKSFQGIQGTREYGKNTDGRFLGRLLPGPEINTINLSGAGNTEKPTSIFEALGYIFICCGRRVFRVHPTTLAVTLSRDFGAGQVVRMGVRWENDFGLVTTDATTQSLWKVTVIGSPDTWTQTADVKAYRLATGINRLFKIDYQGVLKNIPTGLDPMVEANWGDNVQVGEISTRPTSLIAYERTVFVGKPEGVFGVGEEGFGVPIIKRINRTDNTAKGMAVIDPHIFIPHSHGLYRFTPGIVEAVGLEQEIMNRSPVQGPFHCIASEGEWIHGFLQVGSDIYSLVGRERKSGEPGLGAIIWDTLMFFTPATNHPTESIWFSTITTSHTIWFTNGLQVSYIVVPSTGGSPEINDAAYRFAVAGESYTVRYRFNDWNPKAFPKVKAAGRNLSATKYWEISYSLDGAAFSNLDLSGNPMRVNAAGMMEFILPNSVVGREIQYKLAFVSDSNTIPPELEYFEPFALPQPKKVPMWSMLIELQEGLVYDDGIETRTAIEMFNDLELLVESANIILASGPWGEARRCIVRSLQIVETKQTEHSEPRFLVELVLQARDG